MPGVFSVPNTVNPSGPRGFFSNNPTVADQDFKITGITRDSSGAVLGGCVVNLFYSATNAFAGTTVSDPTTGIYLFYVDPVVSYYIVAYKAGSPADVRGTSDNTLVGV